VESLRGETGAKRIMKSPSIGIGARTKKNNKKKKKKNEKKMRETAHVIAKTEAQAFTGGSQEKNATLSERGRGGGRGKWEARGG